MDMAKTEGALEVRLERRINAPAARVWGIISTAACMQQWLGPKTYEPEPGGRVLFDVLHDGTRWLMFGNMQEMVENRSVSFTWQEFDTTSLKCWPVPTLVTVSIDEFEGGCTVQLVHSGFEALPDAKNERDGYEQGWTSRDVLEALEQQAGK